MKNVILFDIDGTLADNTHRLHYIVPPETALMEHCSDKNLLMHDWRFCRCRSCEVLYGHRHESDCGFVKNFVKNWDGFFNPEEQIKDEPIAPAVEVLKSFIYNEDLRVSLITGRPERYRKVTEEWLSRINLLTSVLLYEVRLIMRPDGDQTDDHILKLKQAEEIFGLDKILCVFEDRSRIVKAWRDAGVFCCQVADGDF